MWHVSFIFATWLIYMCDMTHSYVRHDSFICATWLIHMCDMIPSYMWQVSFIFATWLIHTCDMSVTCSMTGSCDITAVTLLNTSWLMNESCQWVMSQCVYQRWLMNESCYSCTLHDSVTLLSTSWHDSFMSHFTHMNNPFHLTAVCHIKDLIMWLYSCWYGVAYVSRID